MAHKMNYICFIRDQIENINKPQLFFIVVSEGGRCAFVAAYNPNPLTIKSAVGYCVHLRVKDTGICEMLIITI